MFTQRPMHIAPEDNAAALSLAFACDLIVMREVFGRLEWWTTPAPVTEPLLTAMTPSN